MSVAGRLHSQGSTAAPPFPFVLGAGGGMVKPRITTVTPASVSVLAESNVVLPCKATGNPETTIAWTKISTGKRDRWKQKEREKCFKSLPPHLFLMFCPQVPPSQLTPNTVPVLKSSRMELL